MSKIEQLFDYIPKKYFVENLKDNRIGHIKLALIRETTNPMIIRSTDPEATVTLVTPENRELVEIPPRKLKSREKLLGLMICREFGVVDPSVRYNSIEAREHLNNPNSVLFGDTVTKEQEAAGLASRVIYDWAYSIRDVKDLTEKLQHNSMGEDGTILKDDKDPTKVASRALHMTEYILPRTFFPHFITVDNVTPELFLHLLFCIINQRRYGAQTTTNATNMENHVVAVGFTDFEKPINSYVISKVWREEKKEELLTLQRLTDFMVNEMRKYYSDKSELIADTDSDKKLTNLLSYVADFWKPEKRQEVGEIYQRASEKVDNYLNDIKLVGAKTTRKTKKTEATERPE